MSKPNKIKLTRVPVLGVIVLCLFAIVSQSLGLTSVVNYVTDREGWEAQKSQYSAVTAEWESMSSIVNTKINDLKKKQVDAETEHSLILEENKSISSKLAKIKGEYEAAKTSLDATVELQRKAQVDEQMSLNRKQKMEESNATLETTEASLKKHIAEATDNLQSLNLRIATNEVTLEGQTRQLQENTKLLSGNDTQLDAFRANLRKTNSQLIKATNDLTEVMDAKTSAISDTKTAATLNDDIKKMTATSAKLKGNIEALQLEKAELEQTITKDQNRVANAKKLLTDYLDKWNNRDALSAEIDRLNKKIDQLKQQEGDLKAAIQLQQSKSISSATVLTDSEAKIKEKETRLVNLQKMESELLEQIIKLNQLKADSVQPAAETEEGKAKND